MGKAARAGPGTEPPPDSHGKRGPSRRRRDATSAGIRSKIRSVAVIAAVIGASGAIVAALIVLVQPLAAKIIDEYWNRTSEIRISDVRFALTADMPSIDVVLWNSTAVTQPVVTIEVSLAQEGLPLLLIEKSVYQLNGELLIDRGSGAVRGSVQGQDRVVYPFDGVFETHTRGAWALLLTIPVREQLAPGETRSIVVVVPSTIDVTARSSNWVTRWLPISSADDPPGSVAGLTGDKFAIAEFLRGRGGTNLRVRAKRGDGKVATFYGSITF